MKQVIRKGFSSIIVDEVPDPVVTPHHVLVQPLCSLISSGTETANIHKDGVLKEAIDNPSHLRKIWDAATVLGPLRTLREVRAKFSDYGVLGYSGAGVIVDKHPTVTDVELGDRVAYGGEGTGHGECILTGRHLVARMPDAVSYDHACFTTIGSIAMNAVRVSEIQLGDTVAVIGLGLVGQIVSQLASLQGARVIATDLREDRVALARQLGADHAILGGHALNEAVLGLTNGRGADHVIIAAAAKSSAPCELGLRLCRDRGRLIVVGAVEMSFPWGEMYMKEIELRMARAYGPGSYDPQYEKGGRDYPVSYVRWTENRNMEEFLRLLDAERVRVGPLITHRYPLEKAADAYETIMAPGSTSLAVVLEYPAPAVEPMPRRRSVRRRVEVRSSAAPAGSIGIGLIGAGNIAKWEHLPALQSLSGVDLRAIHSASGARGKSYARRFGAAYCTTDLDEVLRDDTVQAVVIASRNREHAPQALAALRAGKHAFVEKPMALTEDECRELVQAQRESDCLLTVGFNRRFAPFYVGQKRALANRSGPAVINCRVNSPGISGNYWMADPTIGGAILGEACHFIDLLYWLLDSEPLIVSAFSLPTDRAEPIGQNNLTASFQFADGSIANITYCTVGSARSAGERVEVFAPGLGVASEDFKQLVVNTTQRSKKTRLFAQKGYEAQMGAFVQAIREGKPAAVTVADGTRATVGCLRMLDAARTRQPQPIEWEYLLD
jgi:predicted dehydrogenase/threonine dehydrogenase-like Zn-dependent dehydrogenase